MLPTVSSTRSRTSSRKSSNRFTCAQAENRGLQQVITINYMYSGVASDHVAGLLIVSGSAFLAALQRLWGWDALSQCLNMWKAGATAKAVHRNKPAWQRQNQKSSSVTGSHLKLSSIPRPKVKEKGLVYLWNWCRV